MKRIHKEQSEAYAALNYVLAEAATRKPPTNEEARVTSKLAQRLLLLRSAARTDALIEG
jgi:hypothetical protein